MRAGRCASCDAWFRARRDHTKIDTK
ncbi:hypothetical protein [Burkholderia ubonensis]